MSRKRIFNIGHSVYWGRNPQSITPQGEPFVLEIYQDSRNGSLLFSIGTQRSLDFVWSKYWPSCDSGSAFKLINKTILNPVLFGWAAVIEYFKDHGFVLANFKLFHRCPYSLEHETFFAETQPVFLINKTSGLNPATIIYLVDQMYTSTLNQEIIERKQILQI